MHGSSAECLVVVRSFGRLLSAGKGCLRLSASCLTPRAQYVLCPGAEKAKNEELVRRELTLSDSSGAFVSLALFGAQALQLPESALADTPLVAIKGD